jgi:hypothetical protein
MFLICRLFAGGKRASSQPGVGGPLAGSGRGRNDAGLCIRRRNGSDRSPLQMTRAELNSFVDSFIFWDIFILEPRNRFSAWRAGTTTLFDVPARLAIYVL